MSTKDMVNEIRLLKLKLLSEWFSAGASFADLGSASGDYFTTLLPFSQKGYAVDLSSSALNELKIRLEKNPDYHNKSTLLLEDIRETSIPSSSLDFVFSFSTLYIVPHFQECFHEIHRILKPGGTAILDLSNSRSLNHFVSAHHENAPKIYGETESSLRRILNDQKLQVLSWQNLQILPYWGKRPIWLWPLLGPFWKTFMAFRIAGRLLDEWICRCTILKHFAFRHLVVVRKESA